MSSPVEIKPESKLAIRAAETRAKLIATALSLITTREFHRESLDAIARRAGVTKGAIYGHFASKDALMAAALETRPGVRTELLPWPATREGTVRERLRRIGEAVADQVAGGGAAGAAHFMFYAATQEGIMPYMQAMTDGARRAIEAKVRVAFAPEELTMPLDAFVLMVATLAPGLMFARAFDSAHTQRETIVAMFEGLARP